MSEVLRRAVAALGDREKAERWLAKPNRALQGERPCDMVQTEDGRRRVLRVLHNIEHGLPA